MGLAVCGVSKKFGNKTAVDDISFSIDTPGIFGLLGTNGAGKSTTIRMILGILEKDSGKIEWNGKPVTRETVRFGYLPEERGLYPKVKIGEQLMYFARLRGVGTGDAKKAISYWYDKLNVGGYDGMTAEQLSKGNLQKIQLITALLHDPELIVLDEPLSGLDPVNADLFREIISELAAKGKYIVMSCHQMELVEEFCRDILILISGRTVLKGNLREIKKGYGRTNLFIGCDSDIKDAALSEGMKIINRNEEGLTLKIPTEESAYRLLRRILQNGIRVWRFDIQEPTLHEIFVEKAREAQ